MKKRFIIAAVFAGVTLSSAANAAKKYYISIGCYPDYKMHRIACDVGTSWKVCAKEACGFKIADMDPAQKARAERRAPKLFSPLPPTSNSEVSDKPRP